MTNPDAYAHPLGGLMSESFSDLIEQGAVDIVAGDHEDEWEIQADDWTLVARGWPPQSAFIAIDDEPADALEALQTLDSALGPDGQAAMRSLNARLDRGLEIALRLSRDELSMLFAAHFLNENDDDDRTTV